MLTPTGEPRPSHNLIVIFPFCIHLVRILGSLKGVLFLFFFFNGLLLPLHQFLFFFSLSNFFQFFFFFLGGGGGGGHFFSPFFFPFFSTVFTNFKFSEISLYNWGNLKGEK